MRTALFYALFFCVAFSALGTVVCNTEHLEITCTEEDLPACRFLLVESEKMYERLAREFDHQFKEKIQIHLYPNLISLHQAINQQKAPDWLICTHGSPIHIVSPYNPGPYHSCQTATKALLKAVIERFIYDKFPQCRAPWWLIAGITAKKTQWPYSHPRASSFPGIRELESATYGDPGMGWYALSLTSYIEEKCSSPFSRTFLAWKRPCKFPRRN
ncbi:MAG TPA: hypothetical protein VGJ00_03455 [Rhabdochlamydiaceae bacterium]|jgi:hypothetical protein